MALLFFNTSVKHWPILIFLAGYFKKKLDAKVCKFWPLHLNVVATLPCEMQK